ncbi:IclR family transcriptional regulator [Mycobacterium neglectum]|jgi:IclR family acetate operon transcriptional repressor|uniref:IclR family transcriptional regulator n=1 Tax=Mycobacterium neglectum TaxID=242737 RepID=UPI000BFEE576|nr:IclR family transcriptional regulator [Mycobacterium neglectum]
MADSTSGAKTLERGLGLLDHVAEGTTRLDDIARAAGLSRSSTHRMLTTLVETGFLSLGANHEYQLGIKLLQLGSHAQASIDVSRAIQAELEALSARTLDATHLGVLVDADVLYLAKARGRRGIEMMSHPGIRLRAQNTAMGKVLLSALPDIEAAARFDPEATPTPNSVRSLEEFLAGLAMTRERGYAVEDQENELGITCVAIGIPAARGHTAVALSVSAPSVHLPATRYADVLECLRDAQTALNPLLPAGLETYWGASP